MRFPLPSGRRAHQRWTATVFLLIAAACGGTADSTPVPPAGSVTAPEASTSTTSEQPRETTTLPPPTTTTTTLPPPEGLHPLVEGHNDLADRRINLIFAAHDVPATIDWIRLAEQMLTWNGPVPITRELEPAGPSDEIAGLTYGPFAIEPFRSHRDLFNVWYYDEPAPSPTAWGAAREPFPVDLPNRLVITLAWEWPFNAAAVPPAFVPPELPEPGADVFVGLTMPIRSDVASFGDETLAHELGHSVFSLADKYVFDVFGFDGRSNWSFYPACATDQSQAEEFFGDLVGTVDPAFETFVSERAAFGLPFDEATENQLRDLIRVDFVPNGCFGPEGVAIRSTDGGLMYAQDLLPVMGAVNRRWAEQVLDAWAGN